MPPATIVGGEHHVIGLSTRPSVLLYIRECLFRMTRYLFFVDGFQWTLAQCWKGFSRSEISEWSYNSTVKSRSEWLENILRNTVAYITGVKWITTLKPNKAAIAALSNLIII